MNKLLAPLVHPLIILDAAFSSEKKMQLMPEAILRRTVLSGIMHAKCIEGVYSKILR